jgi:hypothetical protein
MKGVFTLGIYVAIGITGTAFGQSSPHVKDVPQQPMSVQTIRMPPATIPPGWKPMDIKPLPLEGRTPDVVVIKYGQGGIVAEHKLRFADYRRTRAKVELRGPCYSACTMLTTYIEPENLCIAEGAFMAFHAVRSSERKEYMENETFLYFLNLPRPIQQWLNKYGSWQALPVDGFFYMRDHELWAMGYPQCK